MKCVLMDCISQNGNIFYASSLDSAQVWKGKGGEEGRRVGEGRVSVQEHKREGAQDRDLQFEGKK